MYYQYNMNNLFFVNQYIAVILENYSQATEEVQEGLTDDDYDMYYEIWAQFDPDGTQYIRYDQLSDFLDLLEPPLQIHKPNKFKVISMDIPICKGDMMYCVDILDALTRDFFARKGGQAIYDHFTSTDLHFWSITRLLILQVISSSRNRSSLMKFSNLWKGPGMNQ
jgi:hypothetical protein